ncbi:MAG: DUF5808 domain-containing protein [Berryella intestinalis]|uniref:DUF5808 domain-containing protein n=1 Tax=Berryella intestinalis TaxID=1531429 RepID=UPI002A4E40AC|nr:DUF5808 domain-containing protein [Berryella intestinalis]MDD7369605.1 DUF5808 domain-containing protein [Berryella intestinalis]MDY3128566.1 DUF5808 domain-containing protein [Berryella intestinalis]
MRRRWDERQNGGDQDPQKPLRGLGAVALSVGFLVPMIRHYSQFKRVWDAVSPADPKAWRGGVVYLNPVDPRLFVPREYGGIGMTLNFAHRRAKWGMIAFLAATAGFVAFCVLAL